MTYTHALQSMVSGMCKWVGHEGIHVYCWAPCDTVTFEDGRQAWQRREPRYKVWTVDSKGSPWDGTPLADSKHGWQSAAEASVSIAELMDNPAGALPAGR